MNKKVMINERLQIVNGVYELNMNWYRWPSTVAELSELQDLNRMVAGLIVSAAKDGWTWNGQQKDAFSVRSVRNLLISDVSGSSSSSSSSGRFKWEGWVPLKVGLLTWRVAKDRIPTRLALARRHVNIQDVSCPLCGCANEDINHLMVQCLFAYGIWSAICKWCNLDPFYAYDFDDLMSLYKNVHSGKWRKKIIRGIVMVTTWVIWNVRNEKVFKDKDRRVMEAVMEVKSKSFLWLKYRSIYNDIIWNDWVKDPLYMCV